MRPVSQCTRTRASLICEHIKLLWSRTSEWRDTLRGVGALEPSRLLDIPFKAGGEEVILIAQTAKETAPQCFHCTIRNVISSIFNFHFRIFDSALKCHAVQVVVRLHAAINVWLSRDKLTRITRWFPLSAGYRVVLYQCHAFIQHQVF